MKNANWKDIAELIGITAIVLSLIFVGLQLRQSEQIAYEDLVSYSNERQNAIRELILSDPDVWYRACLNEPLEPVERVIAGKIFDAWTDHIVGEYALRLVGIRQSEESAQQVIDAYAAQLWVYPGLRQLRDARRDWDHDAQRDAPGSGVPVNALLNSVEDRLNELMASGETPEPDVAWCGRT